MFLGGKKILHCFFRNYFEDIVVALIVHWYGRSSWQAAYLISFSLVYLIVGNARLIIVNAFRALLSMRRCFIFRYSVMSHGRNRFYRAIVENTNDRRRKSQSYFRISTREAVAPTTGHVSSGIVQPVKLIERASTPSWPTMNIFSGKIHCLPYAWSAISRSTEKHVTLLLALRPDEYRKPVARDYSYDFAALLRAENSSTLG